MLAVVLDWQFWAQLISASFGLLGQMLVNRQLIGGYYFWSISNVLLVVLHISLGMWILVMLHAIYLALCIDGMIRWKRAARP